MKIIIDSKERRDLAISLVSGIRQADCPMQVTIEPYIEKHTKEQRALFHVLCREWGNQKGYTMAQVKEGVKQAVYGVDPVEINGKTYYVTGSTEVTADGKLRDKTDYSELIEHTYRLAAEDGVILE